MRIRWSIKRGTLWYAGADTWTSDYNKRYLWYNYKPEKHIIFKLYEGCELIEEYYSGY